MTEKTVTYNSLVKLHISLMENACLIDKDKQLIGRYIKNNDFVETEIQPEQLLDIIEQGNIMNYLYKDKRFRKCGKDYSIYKGFQVLLVDVDGVPVDPETFISLIPNKPTAYCTSYSNKIKDQKHPNGDKEWRFHLYYAFNEPVYGIDNFYTVFDAIVSGYPMNYNEDSRKYVNSWDANVRNPKYTLFTSYKDKPQNKAFYRSGYTGIIYNVSYFNLTDNSIPTFNYEYKEKLVASKNKKVNVKQDFILDPVFLTDLQKLPRKTFIEKYEYIYPYIDQTIIPAELYKEGKTYVDLRGVPFYSVPTSQTMWDPVNKKPKRIMVRNGKRNTQLYVDANVFKKTMPNATKEHFVYCITTDLYRNFEDSYEFTVKEIIDKARDAWYDSDFNCERYRKEKKLRVNRQECENIGIYGKYNQLSYARKEQTDDDIALYYTEGITLEQHLSILHQNGMKTTKKRLKEWYKNNNIEIISEKELLKELVLYLYNEDNTRSYRTIAELCEEQGYDIKKDKVSKIIKEG